MTPSARRRFHLCAPAGSCADFLSHPLVGSFEHLVSMVEGAVGPGYEVTADPALFAGLEDHEPGRLDDVARAADIQDALADDRTAAIVAIRGGAWLARVLPRIDFDVLHHRAGPVALFGFSELTSLVNVVATYGNGLGVYDNAPAFLVYSLRHHARTRASEAELGGMVPREWMRRRFPESFAEYFRDVRSMIEGRGTDRPIRATLVRGDLEDGTTVEFVGGNLTVFPLLVKSTFDGFAGADGRWLVLEDYNDRLSRLDRHLAHLTLAGFWDDCGGVLLGDFHEELTDLRGAVQSILRYHLPDGWDRPVLATGDVGHVHPMSPLPLRVPITMSRDGDGWRLSFAATALKTTG